VAATTDLLYSTGDMSGLVSGFPMPVVKVDGNDVEAVADQVAELTGAARAGGGPAYLECVTVRLDPHHAHDDQSRYRDTGTLEAAWAQEPLFRARQRLLGLGRSAEELGREQQRATELVTAAVSSVIDAPPASIDLVYAHTYFEGQGR